MIDQALQTDAADERIVAHLPLVKHVLGRILGVRRAGVDFENLESAGVLGLVEAARKFDAGRNAQFKTYAYLRIRGAILDEIRRDSPLPQQMMERVALVKIAIRRFDGSANIENLASVTGLTTDEVSDAIAADKLHRMVSWERTAVPNQMKYADRAESSVDEFEHWESIQQLGDAIEKLPPRERLAVTLYYREELRLREIGAILQLSASRVSRLLTRATFELGRRLRSREMGM